MNNQEIFDIVSKHLLTQNKRAMISPDQCRYRASDGCKCAVGVLIKDEFYSSALESHHVSTQSVRQALEESGVPATSHSVIRLLSNLQVVHDKYEPEYWPAQLQHLAKEFNLEFNA